MAWANVGARGNNNSTSAGTSLATTIATGNVTANNVVVVVFAFDNTATADGATTVISVTDSQSNTYTRAVEYQNTNGGAAGDGAGMAIFYSKIATGLTSGSDTITVSHPSLTARAMSIHEFSFGAGSTVSVAGSNATGQDAGTTPSATISGLSNQEYLFIGNLGMEGRVDPTTDADYTTITIATADTGLAGTSMKVIGGYRILTGTGDTYNPTLGASRDTATGLVALLETVGGGGPAPTSAMKHTLLFMGVG